MVQFGAHWKWQPSTPHMRSIATVSGCQQGPQGTQWGKPDHSERQPPDCSWTLQLVGAIGCIFNELKAFLFPSN